MKQKHRRRSPGFLHSRVISIISIAMVLFLLGVVTMVGLVGKGLAEYVRESMIFTLTLSPDATQEEIGKVDKKLSSESFIRSYEYISKEEALKQVTIEIGEDPEEFLGWNPQSPSFEIKVKSEYVASPDSMLLVENAFSGYPLVQKMSYKRDLMEGLNHNISTITLVMLAISTLLLLISFVLINNTIRLLIYSKRFIIYTMKLVGATPRFIRRPFIRYNVVSGILASIVALLFLGWLWSYLIDVYPYLGAVLTLQNALVVAGVVLLLGIVIALVSSYLAVNKYLSTNLNKLHRM